MVVSSSQFLKAIIKDSEPADLGDQEVWVNPTTGELKIKRVGALVALGAATPEVSQAELDAVALTVTNLTAVVAALAARTAALPNCVLARSTGQVIATATSVPIQWTSAPENVGAMWAAGSPSKITVVSPGTYVFSASMQYDGNAGGTYRYIYLRKTTAIGAVQSTLGATGIPSSAAGLGQRLTVVSPAVAMLAGDFVEAVLLHDMGSDRNFDNGIMGGYAILLT